MEITVIQKSTNSWLVLSFDEFKKRFKIEFMCAYQEYICHETEKIALLPEFTVIDIEERGVLTVFIKAVIRMENGIQPYSDEIIQQGIDLL